MASATTNFANASDVSTSTSAGTPEAISRLIESLNRNRETTDLVALFSCEPAFATELLREANSPRFGLRKQVTSIQHAVAILGRDALRRFAIDAARRLYSRPLSDEQSSER